MHCSLLYTLCIPLAMFNLLTVVFTHVTFLWFLQKAKWTGVEGRGHHQQQLSTLPSVCLSIFPLVSSRACFVLCWDLLQNTRLNLYICTVDHSKAVFVSQFLFLCAFFFHWRVVLSCIFCNSSLIRCFDKVVFRYCGLSGVFPYIYYILFLCMLRWYRLYKTVLRNDII